MYGKLINRNVLTYSRLYYIWLYVLVYALVILDDPTSYHLVSIHPIKVRLYKRSFNGVYHMS